MSVLICSSFSQPWNMTRLSQAAILVDFFWKQYDQEWICHYSLKLALSNHFPWHILLHDTITLQVICYSNDRVLLMPSSFSLRMSLNPMDSSLKNIFLIYLFAFLPGPCMGLSGSDSSASVFYTFCHFNPIVLCCVITYCFTLNFDNSKAWLH